MYCHHFYLHCHMLLTNGLICQHIWMRMSKTHTLKLKDKLLTQSRVDITKKAAVPYLVRELAHCKAVYGRDVTKILKMLKKITRKVALKKLTKYPLNEDDKRFVINTWTCFLGTIHIFHAQNARTMPRQIFSKICRKLKPFSCQSSASCNAFKKYKCQPKHHEMDARNSVQAVLSFYSIGAKAHNKAIEMCHNPFQSAMGFLLMHARNSSCRERQ